MREQLSTISIVLLYTELLQIYYNVVIINIGPISL